MDTSFHFPPVKRRGPTVDEPAADHEGTTHCTSSVDGGGASFSRSKPPQPPLYIPPGHVAFRLVCHASRVGGLIGKSGSIIKHLQQLTNSKVRVEDPYNSLSEHRVISVISSPLSTNRITIHCALSRNESGRNIWGTGAMADGDECLEVSAAQEGVLRVFERVVEVAIDEDSISVAGTVEGTVSCRLVVWKSQVGAIIGKGGETVEKIRDDTGSRIKILKPEMFPSVALPTDSVVEIEGDIVAVKKAIIAVTSRLQEFPPLERTTPHGARSFEVEYSKPIVGSLLQQHPVLQSMPSNSIMQKVRDGTLPLAPEYISKVDSITSEQEVVFKMLCPNYRVGAVIGKGGSIVKALQSESGASIRVGCPLTECDERVITICALENIGTPYSPAQKAAILVFSRCMEVGLEKGCDLDLKRLPVSTRLLVPSNQVHCLLGREDAIISEMRKMTGADIQIIGGNQVPKGGSENDEVVQISGEFVNVQAALSKVTGRLRESILSMKPSIGNGTHSSMWTMDDPFLRVRDTPPSGLHPSFFNLDSLNEINRLTRSTDHLGSTQNIDRPFSPGSLASLTISGENKQHAMEMSKQLHSIQGGAEFGSDRRSKIGTNTTVEIVVPANAIGSIYGENGSNLNRLRQISGAKIVILEPQPGAIDRIVAVSGTWDETLSARSLLQAFIVSCST